MLETGSALKFIEEDDYEKGCLPETARCWQVDVRFEAKTIEELLNQMKNYYDVNSDDMQLDSCGEDGRIDIQIMEDKNGYKATEGDIELWKQGRKKLYLCTYSYNVTKVIRQKVRLLAS